VNGKGMKSIDNPPSRELPGPIPRLRNKARAYGNSLLISDQDAM
jgi:hypothetical protein